MASLRRTVTFWSLFILIAVGVAMHSARKGGLVEMIRFYICSDLMTVNADLKTENEKLTEEIEGLLKQNQRLKRDLVSRTIQFPMLSEIAREPQQLPIHHSQNFMQGLENESFLNQQIYRALLAEKKRWDEYHQAQYQNILESTLEPAVVDSQYLIFEEEKNRETFLEIENTLNLYKRLIRDVRLFHDEAQYRQQQIQEDPSYELYDLKFNLEPFARESAIADAMQQAMSAMGAGLYPQDAAQVLDRLGMEIIKPIQELSEWLEDPKDSTAPEPYNYNFYIVFGKKLINYADTLARQSLVPLAPSALGELDFFSRKMSQSLVRLYDAGGQGILDSTLLDVQALEEEKP